MCSTRFSVHRLPFFTALLASTIGVCLALPTYAEQPNPALGQEGSDTYRNAPAHTYPSYLQPPMDSEGRPEAWLTDNSIPSSLEDMQKKLIFLKMVTQDEVDRWMWNREHLPLDSPGIFFDNENAKNRLIRHFFPKPHPWDEQKRTKTGLYAHEERINAYLGSEMAQWCAKEDSHCTQPLAVNILCDISQEITCQTIARAVRLSEKMFLLYPYISTPQQRNTEPDVTLVFMKPKGLPIHALYIIKSVADKSGEVELKKKTDSLITYNWGEKPNDITATPWSSPENVMKLIEKEITNQ